MVKKSRSSKNSVARASKNKKGESRIHIAEEISGDETKNNKAEMGMMMMSSRRAPLPPPDEIEDYEKNIKNAGERFMRIVEDTNKSSIKLREVSVKVSIILDIIKTIAMIAVVFFVLFLIYHLSTMGETSVAIALVVTFFGGGSVFVVSNLFKNKGKDK